MASLLVATRAARKPQNPTRGVHLRLAPDQL